MKNLSFYQEKFCDALFFAKTIAEKTKCHIATLPDLINMRANKELGDFVWEMWFTSLTTLYFGMHKDKRLIVVAHHLGPLNTKERLEEWGSSGSNDEGSDRKAYGSKGLPKITQNEFEDLISGKYGPVSVFDFDEYCRVFGPHIYPNNISSVLATRDYLLKSLFGEHFEEFVNKHLQISSDYAKKENKDEGAEYKILEFGIRDRYGWWLFSKDHKDFPEKEPVALFLTLGNPGFYGNNDLSVKTEIRTNEDFGSANFVVFSDPKEDTISIGYSPTKHWKRCLVDSDVTLDPFFSVIRLGNKLFVEYPKVGARMDTGEAMFEVIEINEVGNPTSFKTKDCWFFLRYSIGEVKSVMPEGANAYEVIGDVSPGDIVNVPVQFFNIKADTSKRILSEKEVMGNLPLLLEINNVSID